MRLRVQGPPLVVETFARRLAPLGLGRVGSFDGNGGVLDWGESGGDGAELEVAISWHGPAGLPEDRPASEATVQALSGLMHLHGHDDGGPRRIGLEVASVAAGILAAQAVLAVRIGRHRGQFLDGVGTSVLQAGLLLVSHHIAAATCAEGWDRTPPAPAPGPPFCSGDGRWFEIETLDPEAWKSFWFDLGAGPEELGRAWALFRARYYRGTCSLPPGLHEATAGHSLATIAEVADRWSVSLSPLRSYRQVLAEPGSTAGHPELGPFTRRVAAGGAAGPTRPGLVAGSEGENLPLRGVVVVEATSRLQGPFAGLLLQMLGAQVVRVEPPGGDFGRIVPPVAGDTGSFFLCCNRGKEVVEIDLGQASGRAALVELVSGADVFLHNWRPGKAAEWGLDAEDLLAVNPRLVHASASGWGERPPGRLLGTDFLVQAYAGLGNGLRPEGEQPFPSRLILVDYFGALIASEGILTGLYRREQHGCGVAVRTSLLAGAMALQAHVLDRLARGQEEGRRGGRPQWGPLARPVAAADAAVVMTVEDDEAYRRLCELCEVVPGESPATTSAALLEGIAGRPALWWEERLTELGIPCAVLPDELDPGSLPADPRLAGLFETLAEECRAPASPWHFAPANADRRPPG